MWRPRRREYEPEIDDDRVDRHRLPPAVYLFRAGGGYVQYGQYTLQRDLISVGLSTTP